MPRTLSGKKLEVPVKRILTGTPVETAAAKGALANPESLIAFEELAAAEPTRPTLGRYALAALSLALGRCYSLTRPRIARCKWLSVDRRSCSDDEARAAFEVGRLLARRGAVVLCGGGSGVMAAAAAGARSAGGLVVGIRPGADPGPAADNLSVVLTTNLGEARNAVLVASADAVIVVGGSWGTLSELALAMRRAQDLPAGALPVVSLGGWQVLDADGRPVARDHRRPRPGACRGLRPGPPRRSHHAQRVRGRPLASSSRAARRSGSRLRQSTTDVAGDQRRDQPVDRVGDGVAVDQHPGLRPASRAPARR